MHNFSVWRRNSDRDGHREILTGLRGEHSPKTPSLCHAGSCPSATACCLLAASCLLQFNLLAQASNRREGAVSCLWRWCCHGLQLMQWCSRCPSKQRLEGLTPSNPAQHMRSMQQACQLVNCFLSVNGHMWTCQNPCAGDVAPAWHLCAGLRVGALSSVLYAEACKVMGQAICWCPGPHPGCTPGALVHWCAPCSCPSAVQASTGVHVDARWLATGVLDDQRVACR